MSYTESFKEQMVRRMIGPPVVPVRRLVAETGVSKTRLYEWKKASMPKTDKPAGEKKWTSSEKLRVLGGGEQPLEGEAFGALLRREGLHEAQVEAWRVAAAEALGAEAAPDGLSASALRQEFNQARARVKELERELLRKDRALAEAGALLLLEKNSWRLAGATGTKARARGATSDARARGRGDGPRRSSGSRVQSPGHLRANASEMVNAT